MFRVVFVKPESGRKWGRGRAAWRGEGQRASLKKAWKNPRTWHTNTHNTKKNQKNVFGCFAACNSAQKQKASRRSGASQQRKAGFEFMRFAGDEVR